MEHKIELMLSDDMHYLISARGDPHRVIMDVLERQFQWNLEDYRAKILRSIKSRPQVGAGLLVNQTRKVPGPIRQRIIGELIEEGKILKTFSTGSRGPRCPVYTIVE